jgi:hypothetical protein
MSIIYVLYLRLQSMREAALNTYAIFKDHNDCVQILGTKS